VLGINGTENTLKPPPVIGQKATGIRDFLPHEFAKILTFAPLVKLRFSGDLALQKSLAEVILLRGLSLRSGAGL
jgi:hypothetical protein